MSFRAAQSDSLPLLPTDTGMAMKPKSVPMWTHTAGLSMVVVLSTPKIFFSFEIKYKEKFFFLVPKS